MCAKFTPDYNEDLKFDEQCSKEEIETLNRIDPYVQTQIKSCLLFRFLPATLMDMFQNEDIKTFLDIYKYDDIQNEYIIWNYECRLHLLETLRKHFKPHIENIFQFLNKGFEHTKIPGNLPLYSEKFSEVVQYETLDKEIKIGKYYARMWVKNATSIQMTNEDLEEFYLKIINLVKVNFNPVFLKQSEKNAKEGVNNLSICVRMVIKLIDVFNYKKIISIDILEKILLLETSYEEKASIWELITLVLEMIRKALRWNDNLENQASVIVKKIEQIYEVLNQRIKTGGLTLVYAEALSELINITNIMVNNTPTWILNKGDKNKLLKHISQIYSHF